MLLDAPRIEVVGRRLAIGRAHRNGRPVKLQVWQIALGKTRMGRAGRWRPIRERSDDQIAKLMIVCPVIVLFFSSTRPASDASISVRSGQMFGIR